MISILSVSVVPIPSYADGRRARGRVSGKGTDRDRRIEVKGKRGCYEKSMDLSSGNDDSASVRLSGKRRCGSGLRR